MILAGAAAAAGPEGRTARMERADADREALEAVEREFPAALLRGDAALLARYTADDFEGMDPAGRAVTKADVLARLKAADVKIESLRHEDVRVRVFGDCAVATARTVLRATPRRARMSAASSPTCVCGSAARAAGRPWPHCPRARRKKPRTASEGLPPLSPPFGAGERSTWGDPIAGG